MGRQLVDETAHDLGAQRALFDCLAEFERPTTHVPVLLKQGQRYARPGDGKRGNEIPVFGVEMGGQRLVEVRPFVRRPIGVDRLERHEDPGQHIVDSVVIRQQGVPERRGCVVPVSRQCHL